MKRLGLMPRPLCDLHWHFSIGEQQTSRPRLSVPRGLRLLLIYWLYYLENGGGLINKMVLYRRWGI